MFAAFVDRDSINEISLNIKIASASSTSINAIVKSLGLARHCVMLKMIHGEIIHTQFM